MQLDNGDLGEGLERATHSLLNPDTDGFFLQRMAAEALTVEVTLIAWEAISRSKPNKTVLGRYHHVPLPYSSRIVADEQDIA